MLSKNLIAEKAIEQWPDNWDELSEMLSSYEQKDLHFWKNIVMLKLTTTPLSEDAESEYKVFFETFWNNVRPLMINKPDGLIVAAENGLDIYIKNWLQGLTPEKSKALVNHRMPNGNTALHIAAKYGDLSLAKILIEHGADINASGMFNQTPLHFAAYENHPDMIHYLLNLHANYKTQRNDGEMPIHVAAEMGSIEAVNVIINHDRTLLKSCAKEARTPLYIAAMNNNTTVMQALLDQGDDINQFNPYNRHTIMHMAAIKNNPNIIAFSVANNGKLDLLDGSQYTPLQRAAMQKNPSFEAAKSLIEAGADVNAGNPPPYYLLANNVGDNIERGKKFAELLIQHGAIINPKQYWETPFDPIKKELPSHKK